MGTERKLARFPDSIADFFTLMLGTAINVPQRLFLFDYALATPGWTHGWDIVLKRTLSSLSWFAPWLDGLKSIIAFCRSLLWRGIMVRHVRHSLGKPIIAAMIDAIRVPSVAEWRWGTLWSAVSNLQPTIHTLGSYFDPTLFSTSKDAKKLKSASQCLHSSDWQSQFEFIVWFTTWICEIQSWGKGSKQRDEALAAGTEYNALCNGRRMGEAEVYVDTALTKGLSACNSFTCSTFGDSFDDAGVLELQVAVRGAYVLGRKRHEWLSRLPYLLVRMFEPGMKSRILQQYAEFSNHHSWTNKILSPGCQLRLDFDAMDESSARATASMALRREQEALELVPVDDSIAESPHSIGNRLAGHARGSTFGWVAASMRLEQNLTDVNAWTADDKLECDLTQEWLTYTNLPAVQPEEVWQANASQE